MNSGKTKKIAVVALGGNALLRGNQTGTINQQEDNTYETCINLIKLLKDDYNIVITHGNGPQVGNIMLRNEAGFKEYKIPKMPLDICVADSQGGIGYIGLGYVTSHIKAAATGFGYAGSCFPLPGWNG